MCGAAGPALSVAAASNAAECCALYAGHSDLGLRKAAACALGEVASAGSPADIVSTTASAANVGGVGWEGRHGAGLALEAAFRRVGRSSALCGVPPSAIDAVEALLDDDRVPCREAGAAAAGRLLFVELRGAGTSGDVPAGATAIVSRLAIAVTDSSSEVRRSALWSLKLFAKSTGGVCEDAMLRQLVPAVLPCVKDRTISVKLAAERALLHMLSHRSPGCEAAATMLDEPMSSELREFNRLCWGGCLLTAARRMQAMTAAVPRRTEQHASRHPPCGRNMY